MKSFAERRRRRRFDSVCSRLLLSTSILSATINGFLLVPPSTASAILVSVPFSWALDSHTISTADQSCHVYNLSSSPKTERNKTKIAIQVNRSTTRRETRREEKNLQNTKTKLIIENPSRKNQTCPEKKSTKFTLFCVPQSSSKPFHSCLSCGKHERVHALLGE